MEQMRQPVCIVWHTDKDGKMLGLICPKFYPQLWEQVCKQSDLSKSKLDHVSPRLNLFRSFPLLLG